MLAIENTTGLPYDVDERPRFRDPQPAEIVAFGPTGGYCGEAEDGDAPRRVCVEIAAHRGPHSWESEEDYAARMLDPIV